MAGLDFKVAIGRRLFTALATLALAIQILIPQGFMVSTDPGAPGLAICTGHGPLRASDGHGAPGKAPKLSDAPCAFATHATATPLPTATLIATASFGYVRSPIMRAFDVAPGRGLAAPPPRSHAPPLV